MRSNHRFSTSVYLQCLLYCLLSPHNRKHQLNEQFLNASGNGDVRRVTQLLKDGAQVNWAGVLGFTALHHACCDNRVEMLKVLLKHNPLVNLQNCIGYTPLHHACHKGHLSCVDLLLATGQCNLG